MEPRTLSEHVPPQKKNKGGRYKGVPSRFVERQARRAEASGITPLEFFLKILRDEEADWADRKWAAEKAAPYCHMRMMTHEVTGVGGGPIGLATSAMLTVYLPDNRRRVEKVLPEASNEPATVEGESVAVQPKAEEKVEQTQQREQAAA